MKEVHEFRIPERWATAYLPDDAGVRVGSSVRKVVVSPDQPLFELIGRVQRQQRSRGQHLFLTSALRRQYSTAELDQAELLHLVVETLFEPPGELCGTVYDDSEACPLCGAGRRRISPLKLDLSRVPRTRHIAISIGGERVIRERVAAHVQAAGLLGFDFQTILGCGPRTRQGGFRGLDIVGPRASVVEPTTFGLNVFDLDPKGEYRCPRGHVAGLRVLSELTIARESWSGNDIAETTQLYGKRMGYLVPEPMLLISPRTYRILQSLGIKGARYEVVHLS